MTKAATLEDSYLFSLSDVHFHRTLCELSGNKTLTSLWENVAKQLTIIIGIIIAFVKTDNPAVRDSIRGYFI